jgi:hypothetical protein
MPNGHWEKLSGVARFVDVVILPTQRWQPPKHGGVTHGSPHRRSGVTDKIGMPNGHWEKLSGVARFVDVVILVTQRWQLPPNMSQRGRTDDPR